MNNKVAYDFEKFDDSERREGESPFDAGADPANAATADPVLALGHVQALDLDLTDPGFQRGHEGAGAVVVVCAVVESRS